MTTIRDAAREAARLVDGRFGAQPRHEAVIDLELPCPKGTYFYPPFFASAAELAEFWTSVDVPDAVCGRIASLYESWWDHETEHAPERTWDGLLGAEWDRANPGSPLDPEWASARAEARLACVALLRDRLAGRPRRLDPRDARVAALVIAMTASLSDLPEGEKSRARAVVLQTTQGPMTVAQINIGWSLTAMADHILAPEAYDAAVTPPVLDAEALIEKVVASVEDTVDDRLAAVVNQIDAAVRRERREIEATVIGAAEIQIGGLRRGRARPK